MNFHLLLLSFLTLSTSSSAFSIQRAASCRSCPYSYQIGTRTFDSTRPVIDGNSRDLSGLSYRFQTFSTSTSSYLLSSLSENEASSDRNLGLLVLLTVPFAWGTFEPAVKYVYEIDPPVPALVFSLGYYIVAAASLSVLALTSSHQPDQQRKVDDSSREYEVQGEDEQLNIALRGGLELGTYLFLGNGLQVLGLQTVTADRAAFLLQLTTIFVPLVQGFFNRDMRSIPSKTWIACFIALFGVAVLSLDGKEGPLLDNAANILANFSQGDLFIIAAAFSYTFHCIRLERFAKESSALQLAACKATTETTWSLLLLGGIFGISQSGGDFMSSQATADAIVSFFQTENLLSSPALPFGILAVVWTGLVSVAYTIYAQSFGQSRVSPTDANLIYTIQPVCTAIFAWTLLGETLGPAGYVGGALIGSAVYLVATDEGGGESKVPS